MSFSDLVTVQWRTCRSHHMPRGSYNLITTTPRLSGTPWGHPRCQVLSWLPRCSRIKLAPLLLLDIKCFQSDGARSVPHCSWVNSICGLNEVLCIDPYWKAFLFLFFHFPVTAHNALLKSWFFYPDSASLLVVNVINMILLPSHWSIQGQEQSPVYDESSVTSLHIHGSASPSTNVCRSLDLGLHVLLDPDPLLSLFLRFRFRLQPTDSHTW